jgi:UDP-glucose 4-epimerase
VYGEPVETPISEAHPTAPINAYGQTKLAIEHALPHFERAYGIRSIRLRYFNAAGADPEGRIGEWHEPETHALPLAIQVALGQRSHFTIFGDDYDTRDGTAVRDYVHVLDLADAHVAALRRLLAGGSSEAFNLGTGTGTTVRELINAVGRASGESLNVEIAPRRAGDAPVLVGDNAKARALLGWTPVRNLDAIVSSAWRWHRAQAAKTAP